MNEKLSFIIPCFNCEKTISRTINSINIQNIKVPYEIICINDGSTDNTSNILSELKDKITKIIYYEGNKGPAYARNRGIEESTGNLIYMLDSDNWLEDENTINKILDFHIANPEFPVLCVSEVKYIKPNGLYSHSSFYDGIYTIDDLKNYENSFDIPIHCGNYFYHKYVWEKSGGYCEDLSIDAFFFGIKYLRKGFNIYIVPNTYYCHSIDNNGYWTREEKSGRNKESLQKFFEDNKYAI